MENNRMLIGKLRQALMSGNITYDDIVRRLTKAVEDEYLKPSPNVDFIDTCEKFLWEISTEGQQKFVSVSDHYLEVIKQHSEVKTQARTPNRPVMGFAKRMVLICATFAFLLCITQGAIHFEWFTQGSSTDKQQYIIQGHGATISLIQKCIAEHDACSELKTSSWDELCDYLGFAPSVISPGVFQLDEALYQVYVEPGIIMVNALYETPPGNATALLTIQYYTDVDEALFIFEQDASGEQISINNHPVYVTTNLNRVSFSWISDSAISILAGTFDYELGEKIVEQLIGGYTQ